MYRSWLGSALIAAVMSAAVCVALHASGALAPRSVEVPEIQGLVRTQARDLLATRELLLVLDGETSDPAPPGTLVQQRPLSGSQVMRGSAVHALVAAHPSVTSLAAPPALPTPAPLAPAPPVAAVAPPPPAPPPA